MALTKVKSGLIEDGTIATVDIADGAITGVKLSSVTTPVNILPNTQWQVFTGITDTPQYNHEGTGTENNVAVTSHTTSANTVVFSTTNTQRLKVGDLVKVTDAGADANLKITTLEVDTVVSNTSFTCNLPLGLTCSGTSAFNAIPTMIGDLSGTTGDAADNWAKTAAMYCWRDMHSENRKGGSLYQLAAKKTAGTDQAFYHNITSSFDLEKYKGRKVVFGVWVNHKIKGGSGTWKLDINDGVGNTASSSAAATGYTWLEVTHTVSTSATQVNFQIIFEGDSSDVYYTSQPIASFGEYLGSGNYQQMSNETLIPQVKMTPISYNGAALTFGSVADASGSYGFGLNPYAEANGAIAPTVKTISMQIEARNVDLDEALGFRNQEAVPHIYAVLVYNSVSTQMMTGEGDLTLKNGRAWAYTGTASGAWYNASMDINGYRLS